MLTISESAVEVIKVLLEGDSADESGLRIAPVSGGEAEGLQASVASAPEGGDEVIEESGVRVFLEPTAASALGDKVLDAQQNENGEISLAVRE
jgi:Fe-S cluster assembly iron-binding protein IscA